MSGQKVRIGGQWGALGGGPSQLGEIVDNPNTALAADVGPNPTETINPLAHTVGETPTVTLF